MFCIGRREADQRSQDYYHGGKFNFLRFRGIDIPSKDAAQTDPKVLEFYNNPVIVNDFKNYITKLLTHRNQFNGLTYAEDPTIFAYETGNELGGPIFGDKNVPRKWVAEIAVSRPDPHTNSLPEV